MYKMILINLETGIRIEYEVEDVKLVEFKKAYKIMSKSEFREMESKRNDVFIVVVKKSGKEHFFNLKEWSVDI